MGTESSVRDKDRDLGRRCREAATAATEAVDWLARNRPPSPRIATLQKQLRRHAVEAHRLAVAAERPMSVGVFGASQMGKSFLIGKLITPTGRLVKVVFGSGDGAARLDFLSQVNPAGGNETTGLVTRFSLRPQTSPPGYPVVLRGLREADIVKILANTFRFELKGQYRLQTSDDTFEDRTPTPERIAALADQLARLRQPKPQPGFTIEEVYEVREYIEKNVEDHLLGVPEAEDYWNVIEGVLPYLDADGRRLALGPLWANLEEFDELYLTLKRALDALGHPQRMFTSLAALEDRARGVLHVDSLKDLDRTGSVPQLAVLPDAPTAAPILLPVGVVSALTAELCVTLEEAPWEFFEHTDLLDFPGARARENKTVHEFLRSPEATEGYPRSQCFRRGKVAVLFDNYAADLDLNVMLLCKDDGTDEVKSLKKLVRQWVERTQGETPDRRTGHPPGLFYCMTKCDRMFVVKKGDERPVHVRFDNNIEAFDSWIHEWTPGTPFRNFFLLRNPGIENRGYFDYDPRPPGAPPEEVPPEKGHTEEFSRFIDATFRPMFLGEEVVRRHVDAPEAKLDALLALNDGGTTLLAERLAPVCNPDLKYEQIAPRAERVIAVLSQSLVDFYESGDIGKRVAERTGRAKRLTAALKRRPAEIGPFIASFQVEESLIQSAYRHFRRNASQPSDIFDDLFGEGGDQLAAERSGFGSVVVDWWAKHLAERVPGSPWSERIEVDEEALRGFVEELVIGADRLGANRTLEGRLDEFTLNAMHLDAATRRVSIFGALTVNDLVNFPGGRDASTNKGRFVRPAAPPPGAICDLPENPRDLERTRLAYFADWLRAVEDLARDNASMGETGVVNVEANATLGRILERLGGVPQ